MPHLTQLFVTMVEDMAIQIAFIQRLGKQMERETRHSLAHKNMLSQFWNLLFHESTVVFHCAQANVTLRFTLECDTCAGCTHITREILHKGWIHSMDFDMTRVDDIDELFCEHHASGCCHSAPKISHLDFNIASRLENEPSLAYNAEAHKQKVRQSYEYCSELLCSDFAVMSNFCHAHNLAQKK